MARTIPLTIGLAAGLMLYATAPANAQIHVDVGIATPTVGAHVVLGGAPVYVVQQRPAPIIIRKDRRGGGPPLWAPAWGRRDPDRLRSYARDVRDARRAYAQNLRDARRQYERDLRDARRGRGRGRW